MKIKTLLISTMLITQVSSPIHSQDLKAFDREANMDKSVRPGNDFRQYAVGKWIEAHPMRDDQARNGSFTDLAEKNQKQLQDLILSFTTNPQEKGTLGYKIATLYNQMMDSTARQQAGYEPIKANLEKIRSIRSRKEYQSVLAQLERKGENLLMLGIGVGSDQKDADNNLVGVGQAGLGLGVPDYYTKNGEREVKIREAYRQKCRSLLLLVGHSQEEAIRMEEASFALEMQLAAKCKTRLELRDIEANYNKTTYRDLLTDYPGIEWGEIFLALGFPAFSHIDVGQPEPVREAGRIYAEAPLDDLKAYAEIRLLDGCTGVLSQEFRDVAFEFRKVFNGVTQDDPLWKRATNLVNGLMGDALGKLYCEKYFPESSKQRMLQLVSNLQTALSQRIDEATWMSPETKAKAQDKLSSFVVKIGYPDKWKDYSRMNVDENLSLYENIANISEFSLMESIEKKVNKPVDKSEWHMSPQTVNAYYNPTTNEICFPAGILQPPFFYADGSDPINYGGIGAVIGHEMSHGFDDQGSQFDKTGNQINWWTEADKKAFDARTKVLADYFSTIPCLGEHINGEMTLGENIGDNGGLNIAYRACQNAMGTMTKIDSQDFFFSWAMVWAGSVRDEFLDMQLKNDVHSPAFARINGALPHIDAWYDAFGVKKSDRLYIPKNKRARIW